jgi:hypothetical protein
VGNPAANPMESERKMVLPPRSSRSVSVH